MTGIDESDSALPIGTGPPTREEIRVHYPPKFTWEQLKLFINAGDLGLLKRDKALQARYMIWTEGIKAKYGSSSKYLMNHRLQWGKPDTLSLLPSEIVETYSPSSPEQSSASSINEQIITRPSLGYFTADMSPSLISIIQNDWPYSVPLDVEHALIWTKLPILPPPTLVPPQISATLTEETLNKVTARLQQDGIWGFTGSNEPPPSPSLLPQSLGALSEWGVTLDKLIISPRGSAEEEVAIRMVGNEVAKFIKNRWKEDEWETAWFVNPPRLQSVKDLAHIHVFARKKKAVRLIFEA